MAAIEQLLAAPLSARLGWCVAHFAWQGLAIAGLAAPLLAGLRARSAQARYAVACAALLLMGLAPVVTFCLPQGEPVVRSAVVRPFAPEAQLALKQVAHPAMRNVEPRTALPILPAPMPLDPARIPLAAAPRTPAAPILASHANPPLPFEQLLPWLALPWLIGASGLSIWRLGGWIRVQQLRRGSRPLERFGPDVRWLAAAARVAARLGFAGRVLLRKCTDLSGPVVIGFLRPVILLPVSLMSDLSLPQIEAILAHELAHIRRHDYLVNLLQTVAETLLFYHPAVWWVSRQIRLKRENCCDDLVIGACPDRADYAGALLAVAQSRLASPYALAATGGRLLDRVRRILGQAPGRADRRPSAWAAGLVLAGLIGVALIGCALRNRDTATLPKTPAPAMSPTAGNALAYDRYVVVELAGKNRHAQALLVGASADVKRVSLPNDPRIDGVSNASQVMRGMLCWLWDEGKVRGVDLETGVLRELDAAEGGAVGAEAAGWLVRGHLAVRWECEDQAKQYSPVRPHFELVIWDLQTGKHTVLWRGVQHSQGVSVTGAGILIFNWYPPPMAWVDGQHVLVACAEETSKPMLMGDVMLAAPERVVVVDVTTGKLRPVGKLPAPASGIHGPLGSGDVCVLAGNLADKWYAAPAADIIAGDAKFEQRPLHLGAFTLEGERTFSLRDVPGGSEMTDIDACSGDYIVTALSPQRLLCGGRPLAIHPSVSISPDGRRAVWTVRDAKAAPESAESLYYADSADGKVHELARGEGFTPAVWFGEVDPPTPAATSAAEQMRTYGAQLADLLKGRDAMLAGGMSQQHPRVMQIDTEIARLRANIERLKSLPATAPNAADQLRTYEAQLADLLKGRDAMLASGMSPQHPRVMQIDAEIARLRANIEQLTHPPVGPRLAPLAPAPATQPRGWGEAVEGVRMRLNYAEPFIGPDGPLPLSDPWEISR